MAGEQNQPDFWTAVGATPTRVWWTTFRVLLPWVVLGSVLSWWLAHLPWRTVAAGFAGWVIAFVLVWSVGRSLEPRWMRGLTLLFPPIGAAVGAWLQAGELLISFTVLDHPVPRHVLAVWTQQWLLLALFDGVVNFQLVAGGRLPWLVWPARRLNRDDWFPRPVPAAMIRDLLDALPWARSASHQPDARDLDLLGLTWPCTEADLSEAFSRVKARVLAERSSAAERARHLADLGRARQHLEEALRVGTVVDRPELPDLAELWRAAPNMRDRYVIRQVLERLDPVTSARRFGLAAGPGLAGQFASFVALGAVLVQPVMFARCVPVLGGVLADGDTGSKLEHHDYTVVKDGVSSTFVWVPVFEAYQLIVPGNCGYPDKPVGFWVANRPSSGTENVDWARETFGGFYAGKYEASHADATPSNASDGSDATEGSSSTLKVAPNCVPWTRVTWDHADAACKAYDPACHLMEDDE